MYLIRTQQSLVLAFLFACMFPTNASIDDSKPSNSKDAEDEEAYEHIRRLKREDKLATIRPLHNISRVLNHSDAEKDAIVAKHLEFRSSTSPYQASNMEYMFWDDDLAAVAGLWASVCYWGHGTVDPDDSVQGQNLWLGGNVPDGQGNVVSWHNNEIYFYTYDTNTCDTGKVCGHYTQVVWAESVYVGCARAFCKELIGLDGTPEGRTNKWIEACQYTPAGNYPRVPFLSGPPCTECASGKRNCFNNMCISEEKCTDMGLQCVTVECVLVCENCATLTSSCTCECKKGWHGTTCSQVCENTHVYCGANPGWPNKNYCGSHPAVPKNCPLMCELCEAGSETCDTATGTPGMTSKPATTTSSVLPTDDTIAPDVACINDVSATVNSGVGGTTVTWTEPTATDNSGTVSLSSRTHTPGQFFTVGQTQVTYTFTDGSGNSATCPFRVNVSERLDGKCGKQVLKCLNGGTFQTSNCKCKCNNANTGKKCEKKRKEVESGVELLFSLKLSDYNDEFEKMLRKTVSRIVTVYCNKKLKRCCDGASKNKQSVRYFDFINYDNVVTAEGYPQASETKPNTTWTMLVITVPETTDLCENGTQTSSTRRKRDADLFLERYRRTKDIEVYLPQDVLLELISENIDNISTELNVVIDSFRAGEVTEVDSPVQPAWVVAIIIVVVLLVVVVITIIVIFVIKTRQNKIKESGKWAEDGNGKPDNATHETQNGNGKPDNPTYETHIGNGKPDNPTYETHIGTSGNNMQLKVENAGNDVTA